MSNILATTYDAAIGVTKSDTVDDPQGPFAGLLVAVAGVVIFKDIHGNVVTTGSVAAGTVIPVTCARVNNTNTTATVYGLRANPFNGPKVSA